MSLKVLVLAAGKGTRMKSSIPKVLHTLLKRPIINYVVDASVSLKPERVYIVVGYGSAAVKQAVKSYDIEFVNQKSPLGTGHAVKTAEKFFNGYSGDILILNGDLPAITKRTLKAFVKKHKNSKSTISFITSVLNNPKGYGRVLRNKSGEIKYIVEEKDASKEEKKISEVNSGVYCVDSEFLWLALKQISKSNKQKEYYLPDIISFAARQGEKITAYRATDSKEILGVNNRDELSKIEEYIKARIIKKLMLSGVTVVDPKTTYISPDVKIKSDTLIYPGTFIYGSTVIGSNCTLGPNVFIEDSKIGSGVNIRFSCFLSNCTVENGVTIGPFSNIRPETHLLDRSKIGNFVEIKKSKIGEDSKVPHLSYIGDALVGEGVNIGAGTITCNYDGFDKHRTVIEDGVFIGSDTMLVAPVKVGRGATTAAGSTITKDVSEGSLAIERAKQKELKNWERKPKSSKVKE